MRDDLSVPQIPPDSQPQEEWRDIPGYEGLYQVSNTGNVKSKIKTLSPVKGGSGYLIVSVSNRGKQRTFGVHQLVALTFIGPCPEGHEVDHINCDKTDNRAENLRYLTHLENARRGAAPKRELTTFQDKYPLTNNQHVLLYALSIGLMIERGYGKTLVINVKLVNSNHITVHHKTIERLQQMGCLNGYTVTPFGHQVIAEYGLPIEFDQQAWDTYWANLYPREGSN